MTHPEVEAPRRRRPLGWLPLFGLAWCGVFLRLAPALAQSGLAPVPEAPDPSSNPNRTPAPASDPALAPDPALASDPTPALPPPPAPVLIPALPASPPGAPTPAPAPAMAPSSAAPARPVEARRIELGIIPLIGGDTDVGLGFGELSTLAGLAPGYAPYRWAFESAAFISFKTGEGPQANYINPYQDYYIQFTAPHLLNRRLRLELRPSFTKETTQRYYGLGNASVAPPTDVPSRDFYGRTHPMFWVRARYRVVDHFHAGFGSYYTHNWMVISPDSTLAQQMATGDATVRRILGGTASHGVLLLEALFLYDSRDNEIDPERGQFHQIKLRASPSDGTALPYNYQQINVTSRVYKTIIPDRLVLAARVVADLQFGDPPFYELARYDDTYALGGGNGVRGVPGQRYYGKVKIFSNWEARSRLFQFHLAKKTLTVGVATFVDAGRAWTELASHPELDGTGWGIKYGVGGGVRVQEGKTFVVRLDLAYSPDARPVGAYVAAGQMF
jgi:hypothetical protein